MGHNPIDKISGIPIHERKYKDSDLKFEDVLKEFPIDRPSVLLGGGM